MKELLRSGNKMYLFETVDQIPSIRELIDSPEQCNLFIDSVTLNPKDVNAKLYSQFTKETHRSFIYAFALQAEKTRFHLCYVKQLEMNARRVERLLSKRGICISETEQQVIDFCKSFSVCKMYNSDKLKFVKQLKDTLSKIYS